MRKREKRRYTELVETGGENGRQRQKGDSQREEDAGWRTRGRERIPEALSFNQIHYTEFIAARELIKCRRINSRRSLKLSAYMKFNIQ